jgi:hypothetical protein
MPDDETDLGSPSGSASSGPGMSARRVLEPLSEAECMQLLANGGLGRLVYNSRYGPTALPTVYRIDGESIVLGTWDPALFDEDLRTGIAHAEYQVAVEADQIDLEAREGWIVLVRGAAHHAVRGFPGDPWCHRPLIGVDAPVSQTADTIPG